MNKSTTSTTSHLSSISSSDLIDAKLEEHHELCGSKQYCPGCGHKLEGKPDWVGLPAGVKFDPTDQELVEHLEGKVETSKELVKSHPLIDEFIPTIEGEDGICYTHPEKLPGVTRDGLSRHFFHRPSKAYTTGTRKRRKIQTESDLPSGETRWHKTGKTRPVMVNGKQKGCKKILVLYTNFGKNRRPEKTNWVMHQYHLGQHEEEREGELVVSKIFYQTQPRQCGWSDRAVTTTGEGNGDIGNSIRDGGGGSGGGTGGSSFSKEGINTRLRDEVCAAGAVAVGAMSSYTDLDIEQLKEADHLYFAPFRKSCDEVGVVSTEFSTLREELQGPASSMCEARDIREHQMPPPHEYVISHENQNHQQHHCQNVATTAFHICCRPSHDSISTIVSPPDSGLHHTSVVFDEDSFHVSRIALQNENFQQLQQQHHKLGRGSTSGLEELIMSCTSSDIKEESAAAAIRNPQEPTEWLKYSTNFWPDPDNNPDHHG